MPKLPKKSFYLISGILLLLILVSAGLFLFYQTNPSFLKSHPKVSIIKTEGKKDTSPVKTAFTAQILTLGSDSLTVKNLQDGKNYNVSFNSSTLITSNGTNSSVANIKVGDKVQLYSKTTSTIDPNKTYYTEWIDVQQPLDFSKVETK
ncbi:MAG TPA: hypothetical protein VLE47_04690 [Candidatus Saccharimonadales bacterium]|nr:hypothetical protein [Candidatus Saccharimonadales bacterium]